MHDSWVSLAFVLLPEVPGTALASARAGSQVAKVERHPEFGLRVSSLPVFA
jgi:hypothetical protein